MKVAMISGEYPPAPGGIADYTWLLARHLEALGVGVRVITGRWTMDRGPWTVAAGARGAKSVWPTVPHGPRSTVHRPPSTWSPARWPRIGQLVEGCQVVHIQYQAAAYGLGGGITLLPLWLRLRRPEVRVVTTFHDLRVPYLFPKAGPLRRLAVRALLQGSHAVVLTNPDDLEAAGPVHGRHLVPIGNSVRRHPLSAAQRTRLRRKLGVQPGETLIGYFGFANASKGLDTLVQALAKLRSSGTPARLALVGEQAGASDPTDRATASQVEALLAELGLEQAVVRTGRLAADDVSAHLQACDLVALPFRDGASLRRSSLIATLSQGVPVVTTRPPVSSPRRRGDTESRVGEAEGELRDGEHVLLVPPDDPGRLAQAMARLAADRALRRRLVAGALEVSSRFSWPAIARTTLELYLGLLESRKVEGWRLKGGAGAGRAG